MPGTSFLFFRPTAGVQVQIFRYAIASVARVGRELMMQMQADSLRWTLSAACSRSCCHTPTPGRGRTASCRFEWSFIKMTGAGPSARYHFFRDWSVCASLPLSRFNRPLLNRQMLLAQLSSVVGHHLSLNLSNW